VPWRYYLPAVTRIHHSVTQGLWRISADALFSSTSGDSSSNISSILSGEGLDEVEQEESPFSIFTSGVDRATALGAAFPQEKTHFAAPPSAE
jgi:hypothetical protein